MSRSALLACACAVAAAVLAGAPRPGAGDERAPDPDRQFQRSAQVMGTIVNVTIRADDEKKAAEAIAAVFEEFQRIERLMSSFTDDSDVARINAGAGGQPLVVASEVVDVVLRARDVSRLTGGAFDITVGAFHDVWKFGSHQDGSVPSDEVVEAHRKLVNWRWIKVDRKSRTVKLARKGMRITLGGIAKGYAVDRAVAILHARGYVNFIIQAGGDLYLAGRKGDRPWVVGIRDPRGGREAPFAITEVEDMTFSTSGDYERSFIHDGVRYHHILDPKTGRPARRSRSVTVMAKDAITADGLSTALFVMGHEHGMKLVERLPDVEAVFVDADNNVHVSSGLQGKVKILKPPTPGI